MSFTYENQGAYSYLVYEIQSGDEIDTLSLGMITNNKIPGFAAAIYSQMDTKKFIRYNISAKVSARQFFEGTVNRKQVLAIFGNMVEVLTNAEEYMIDPGTFVMDMNYIYVDVTTYETLLVCLPVTTPGLKDVNFNAFFKNIMFTAKFDQQENYEYVGEIINYLNSTAHFSLEEFKKLLRELTQTGADQQRKLQQELRSVSEAVQDATVVLPQAQTSIPGKSISSAPPVDKPAMPESKPKEDRQTKQAPPVTTPTDSWQAEEEEKKISMLSLLMHYNKENAARYKAQKKKGKADKHVSAQPMTNTGFAVPGQDKQRKQPSLTTQPAVPQSDPIQPGHCGHSETGRPAEVRVTADFGETTVLGGGVSGETTVLSMNPVQTQKNPYLIRLKNNEQIALNKQVFRIGKEKSYVDYFLGDNSAISRSHANIISRNGEYFVVDTNSTNHTYLNGVMIQSNVEMRLKPGDKIRFADEDFEFNMLI